MEDDNLLFYKENDNDIITWVEDLSSVGKRMFTFDGVKIYNLFADYPHNLTSEEKEIFDRENPYWANFFKSRSRK